MTNTYLLEIIKALRPNERQEMALFLASPRFNSGGNAKELAHLYQVILDTAPEFSEMLLDKERVYSKVFPDQNVVQGKLEKLMADLNKLLRVNILIQRYISESKEEEQQIDWANWLRERGLAERSRQVITKLKSLHEREKSKSMQQHRIDLLIAEEEHIWELNYNQVKGDLFIPKFIHHLDLYYHNYRIDHVNRYLLQQKGAQLPNIDFAELELEYYLNDSIILQISHKIFEVLKKDFPTVEETQGLMYLLQSNEKNLSFQTLAHFYTYIRNFCTLLINAGNLEFIPILHEIHKDNLPRGYFFSNGEISPDSYLSLVQVATRAKEFAWAKKFTVDYKGLVIGGDDDDLYYRLNMAHCYFAEGKFEEALKSIPDVPSTFHYHHMIRRLELKIYYEQSSELLLYKLDAFRKFIERTAPKMLAANLREMDLNFLNILLQLAQSPMKDKARSARLIKRIEEKKLLADRAWLLEKARALG